MKAISWTTMFILITLISGCCLAPTSQEQELTPAEAKAIAKDAYIYGFPMVMNYKTMNMYSIDEQSPEYKAPFNTLNCGARVFTPEDKTVVTPNSDTPYCMFWADLRTEPLVITVPEIEAERYYSFQLIDLYTHNFSYIGTLTTGNAAGNYLISSPDWKGARPEGVSDVIPCETDFFLGVVRTQLFSPDDLDNVQQIQDSYGLQGLSAFLGEAPPAQTTALDFPEWKEGAQFTAGAFAYIDFMLSLVTPVEEELALMDRFAKIGLGTDEPFEMSRFSPEMQEALEAGVQEGFEEMETFMNENSHDPLFSAKIFGTREFLATSAAENYGLDNFYVMRMMAAHMGLYGNSGAEALYPTYRVDSDGELLDGSKYQYTLTLDKEQRPPVKAFASLTMYDGETQLLIHNPLDRYLLNSPMKTQFLIEDGESAVFYIQKESPGKEKEANWLPAPDGPFYMVLRLYGPEPEALDGTWMPPALQKVQ